MYYLYEEKNYYCVRIGRDIVIWTCWLNKKLTYWLYGYEWGGLKWHCLSFFSWKKKEMNLRIIQKWIMRITINLPKFKCVWLNTRLKSFRPFLNGGPKSLKSGCILNPLCNSPAVWLDQCQKIPTYSLSLKVNFLKNYTKNSAKFCLYLGHPKLSIAINLLNKPIITRSHNYESYINHHNSTPHTIHTIIYIYIYIYIYPKSKFNINIAYISYHKI